MACGIGAVRGDSFSSRLRCAGARDLGLATNCHVAEAPGLSPSG